jgi:hypothetical protein
MTAADDRKEANQMDVTKPSVVRAANARTTDTGPPDDSGGPDESSSRLVAEAEIVDAASPGSDLVLGPEQHPDRHAKGLLPALRADLSPLLPPLRRAATVVAVAAVADWIVRTGSQRLVRQGASLARSGAPLLAGKPALNAWPAARRSRSETVIIERIIIHRP